MDEGITTKHLQEAIKRVAARMEADAEELNSLDGALGDGDLGITMVRGMRGLVAESPNLPDDVGMALLTCAQVFTKVSGSTYGTLLATGLMSMAKATKGRVVVPWSEISSLLGGAIEAMSKRARSQLGDKTVLDAIEAVRVAIEGLSDPNEIARAADEAVSAALERFRNQPARQGRARIFGEKSIGLDDPGMVAFQRIVKGLRAG